MIVAPSSFAENKDKTLTIYSDTSSATVEPKSIASLNGKDFLRYELNFNRVKAAYKATYSIGSNSKLFETYIPAKGTDPHIFFGDVGTV